LDDQLKVLMDYTKFHIGVYLSLGSASVAMVRFTSVSAEDLMPSLVLLVVAGAAGGVIGSSIPEYTTWAEFTRSRLGALGVPLLRYVGWAKVEHLAFWAAIVLGALRLIDSQPEPLPH
jgi:hypothetical protein